MERQSGEKRENPTYIAAGSKITGEISGSAEVLVDGEFDGRLYLDSTVVIGQEGRVKGEIRARSVRVEGRVVGDVRGIERVEVMASGTLEGDISASRVVIAEGAFFKGNVEMTGKEASLGTGKSASPSSREHQRQGKAGSQPKMKNKHQGQNQQGKKQTGSNQQSSKQQSPQQQPLEANSAPTA